MQSNGYLIYLKIVIYHQFPGSIRDKSIQIETLWISELLVKVYEKRVAQVEQ